MKSVTYSELYDRTMKYSRALKHFGVKTKDRVVGYLPNSIHAVEAMLGTATLAATWSSTSPDFGVTVSLDFSEIILFLRF